MTLTQEQAEAIQALRDYGWPVTDTSMAANFLDNELANGLPPTLSQDLRVLGQRVFALQEAFEDAPSPLAVATTEMRTLEDQLQNFKRIAEGLARGLDDVTDKLKREG